MSKSVDENPEACMILPEGIDSVPDIDEAERIRAHVEKLWSAEKMEARPAEHAVQAQGGDPAPYPPAPAGLTGSPGIVGPVGIPGPSMGMQGPMGASGGPGLNGIVGTASTVGSLGAQAPWMPTVDGHPVYEVDGYIVYRGRRYAMFIGATLVAVDNNNLNMEAPQVVVPGAVHIQSSYSMASFRDYQIGIARSTVSAILPQIFQTLSLAHQNLSPASDPVPPSPVVPAAYNEGMGAGVAANTSSH